MHPAGTTSVTGIDAISLDELREPGIAEPLLEAWQDSLDDAFNAARGTRPELQTTDCDPLVFANDIFEVHPRDHAEIKRRLLGARDRWGARSLRAEIELSLEPIHRRFRCGIHTFVGERWDQLFRRDVVVLGARQDGDDAGLFRTRERVRGRSPQT